MLSKSAVVLLAAATLSLAKTPAGFEPASNTDLIVNYGNIAAQNGAVVGKDATAKQPQIGTVEKMTGTSYAVMMVDLDIPTNNPPETSTLLHWMQTGLTPAPAATTLNTTNGMEKVFLMMNTENTAAFAPYIGPSPPAKIPLSHRYTQILVDTSSASAAQLDMLKTAAANRQGFNANTVLKSAGLNTKVMAGNSFNVTNPGPASNAAMGNSTGTTSSTGSQASTLAPFKGQAGVTLPPGSLAFGLLAAGAVFLHL